MITPRLVVETAIAAGVATWNGLPMCTEGHVVFGDNVAVERGRERCRECKRNRQRQYMARKRKERAECRA